MEYRLLKENIKGRRDLLESRGIQDVDMFLSPDESMLQDQKALANIEEGAQLYLEAVSSDAKILVIVDSDCDGFTSSAALINYTREVFGKDVEYRLHEGKQHGLEDMIDDLTEGGEFYDLIILPDSSSNDFEYHERLKRIGTKCLVIDHHEAAAPFSDNAIIINNQLSPEYKNKSLTGAGVVLQFLRQVDLMAGNLDRHKDYYDLAAVGIIGDMGSVKEMENRFIIKEGLKCPTHNYFLTQMYRKQAYSITRDAGASDAEISMALTPTSVAFYIVPLINAMIRAGTYEEKLRMFMAFLDGRVEVPSNKRGAKGEMVEVATESFREATNAKSRQNRVKEQMLQKVALKIKEGGLLANKLLIIELDETDKFPSELNGVVANHLASEYGMPTLVLRERDGVLKGSGRGVNDSGLASFRDFLIDSRLIEFAEGHGNAFGAGIPVQSIPELHQFANTELKDIDFGETILDIDFLFNAEDYYYIPDLIFELAADPQIWGMGNPEPLIGLENVRIPAGELQAIGAKKDTLKFSYGGVTFVQFQAKEQIARLKMIPDENLMVTVVGTANINEWGGRITPQIVVKDINIEGWEKAF